jgi:hypothetical protein
VIVEALEVIEIKQQQRHMCALPHRPQPIGRRLRGFLVLSALSDESVVPGFLAFRIRVVIIARCADILTVTVDRMTIAVRIVFSICKESDTRLSPDEKPAHCPVWAGVAG